MQARYKMQSLVIILSDGLLDLKVDVRITTASIILLVCTSRFYKYAHYIMHI